MSSIADAILDPMAATDTRTHIERLALMLAIVEPESIDELRCLGVGPGMFAGKHHSRIWSTLEEMRDDRALIDAATVRLRLVDADDSIDWTPTIVSIMESAPSTSYGREAVTELFRLHDASEARRIIAGAAYDLKTASPDDVLARAESALADVRDRQAERSSAALVDVGSVLMRIVDDAVKPRKDAVLECDVGLIDDYLGGLVPQSLNIIAARPGVGKTALGLHVARRFVEAGGKIGVLSLEMSTEQMLSIMLASSAQVPTWKIRKGLASRDESARLIRAYERLTSRGGLLLASPPAAPLWKVCDIGRRMVRDQGARLLVLDYLQLVRPNTRCESENLALTEVAEGLKELARRLNVPLVALCQLNRDASRTGRVAELHDIRGSGAIEQAADTVVVLDRPKDGAGLDRIDSIQATIRKNRHGKGTGCCEYRFDGEMQTLHEPPMRFEAGGA